MTPIEPTKLVRPELWSLGNQKAYERIADRMEDERYDIYIFDLDGTIANNFHREHFLRVEEGEKKDWDSFYAAQCHDTPYKPIVNIMNALIADCNLVVILTGRNECTRLDTEDWLKEHHIPHHALFMRPSGNREDDTFLKIHQIHTYMNPEQVQSVFEDRSRIVKSLRLHGFHVCQVNEGNF